MAWCSVVGTHTLLCAAAMVHALVRFSFARAVGSETVEHGRINATAIFQDSALGDLEHDR